MTDVLKYFLSLFQSKISPYTELASGIASTAEENGKGGIANGINNILAQISNFFSSLFSKADPDAALAVEELKKAPIEPFNNAATTLGLDPSVIGTATHKSVTESAADFFKDGIPKLDYGKPVKAVKHLLDMRTALIKQYYGDGGTDIGPLGAQRSDLPASQRLAAAQYGANHTLGLPEPTGPDGEYDIAVLAATPLEKFTGIAHAVIGGHIAGNAEGFKRGDVPKSTFAFSFDDTQLTKATAALNTPQAQAEANGATNNSVSGGQDVDPAAAPTGNTVAAANKNTQTVVRPSAGVGAS